MFYFIYFLLNSSQASANTLRHIFNLVFFFVKIITAVLSDSASNPGTEKSSFEDKRCKCVCPNVAPNGTILGKSKTWIKDDLDPTSWYMYVLH